MPVGFPPTESGVELRILKRLFSPEEARIACSLKYAPKPTDSLGDIYERLGSTVESEEALERILDGMVVKGLIAFREEGNVKFYAGAQWVIGIYEYQVHKLSKELLADISQYGSEAFGKAFSTTSPRQLRVIPVEKSITHQHDVVQYDNIRELLETAEGPFMVTDCVCGQAREIAGQPCQASDSLERCIGSGSSAQTYIDQGWGREITKEELLEILARSEQDGLVLQPANTKDFHFVCSCCGCCCGVIRGVKSTEKPVQFFSTNYYAVVDHELCTSCGTCTEICQMEAPTLVDDVLTINLDRCIGCGACVANCPSDAMSLEKRESEHIPSDTMQELYARISEHRK